MIFTSYFENLKELDQNGLIPIAICGGIPDYYHGLWYKKLAPSWSIYSQYKETGQCDVYIKRYTSEILSRLNPEQVYQDLYNLADESSNFVMMCYEKPDEFCHRHLVSNWFTEHGICCQEWKNENTL